MPSIILFKRRWLAGSDDLVLPGILFCLTHFILIPQKQPPQQTRHTKVNGERPVERPWTRWLDYIKNLVWNFIKVKRSVLLDPKMWWLNLDLLPHNPQEKFIIATIFVSSSHDLDKWSSYDPDEISQLNANQSSINLAKCANEIRVYTFICITLLVLAMILETALTGFSMQGTVVNSEPRNPVEFLMYFRSLLGVLEVIYSIASIVHLSRLWGLCPLFQHILALEVGIIIVNFSFLVIVILVCICTFDSSGHTFYQLKMAKNGAASCEHLSTIANKFDRHSQNTWNRRLRRCCCCVRDKSNTNIALDEVSHLLRDFFKDLDVVPSDILAGMVLLRHKQQCRESRKLEENDDIEEYFCGRPITHKSKFVDPCSPEESSNYQNIVYYCHYAIAAYGSLFYMVYNPGTGFWKVLHQCLCKGRCFRDDQDALTRAEDGKCCDWETAALKQSLKENLKDSALIYASWKNNLFEHPFFVCVDFDKKAVVVTIRGTLSEMDALTDIVATPDVIPVEGNDGAWKAHKGMIKGANFVKDRLLNGGILEQAFSHDPNRGTNQFQFVLVGHSLGAGIAAILSIMLRPLYPQLVCYSYSPPGGLLSLSAVEVSKQYIHSVVYGKDVVIRTGIRQLLKMRIDLINLLRKSAIPKYKIIFGNPCKPTQDRHSLFSVANNPSNNSDQLLTNPQLLGGCEDLYPPGRILHIVYRSRKRERFCFSRSSAAKSYFVIEANNKEDFDEILMSHNMVTHHWPQELLKALETAQNTSLPGNDTIKYSRSATMPSSASMPSNPKKATNQTDPSDFTVIIDSREDTNHSVHVFAQTISSSKTNPDPPSIDTDSNQIDCSLKGNRDNQNGKDFDETSRGDTNHSNTTEIRSSIQIYKATETKSQHRISAEAIQKGLSVDNRSKQSLAVVHSGTSDDVSPTSSKYERSQSLPHPSSNTTIDQSTLQRARIEPNLIPKPPRSCSMRLPAPEPIVQRDHSAATFSLTSAPEEKENKKEPGCCVDVKTDTASHERVINTSSIHIIDSNDGDDGTSRSFIKQD